MNARQRSATPRNRRYCRPPWPVVDGAWGAGAMAGGVVLAGGAVPVVAGGLLTSVLAVLVPSPLLNTSASTTRMNTPPAIHPQVAFEVGTIRRSISILRSMSIRRSKSRGSVMVISHLGLG